jgi:curved DNA-binding protein
MAARRDFYEVLGVDRSADAKAIQRAYRKLARSFHPDVNKDPAAEDRFKEISEAYDVLSDPELRRRYDTFGPDFRQVPEGVDPATWARARSGTGRGGAGRSGERSGAGARSGGRRRSAAGGFDQNGWDQSGFDQNGFDQNGWDQSGFGTGGPSSGDVDFDDLFGGLFGERGRSRWGTIAGADQEIELPLTIDEAFHGGRRSLTVHGAGGDRTIDVTIPAGVTDGQRIRLAGQGGGGTGGGASGDLYLVVRLRPHPTFRVEGRDIFVDAPLTPWEAALGTTVPVDTPAGEAKVTVPAGTSCGRRLRLRGRGLPNPRGKPGDLFAEAKVLVPPSLTDEERKLFEQLAAASTFDPRRRR